MYTKAFDLVDSAERAILCRPVVKNFANDSVSHDVYYVLSLSQTKFKSVYHSGTRRQVRMRL